MVEGIFKLTNQRQIILDYIKDNQNHPCVEETYNHVKKKLPRISKKTVYSNLKFLVDAEMICEVNLKGVLRYEPKLKPHHHIVCEKCGKIIDFESDEIFKNINKIIKKIKDFEIRSTNLVFCGICSKCKGGKNE